MKSVSRADRKQIEILFCDVRTRHEELEDEARVFNEAVKNLFETLSASRAAFNDSVSSYNEAIEDQQSCIDDALDRMSKGKQETVYDHYQGWKAVLNEGKAIEADEIALPVIEITGITVPTDLPAMKLDDVEE